MTTSALPDFDYALQMAQGNLQARDLSECHGVLCGMLCRRPGVESDDYLSALTALQLLPDSSISLDGMLEDVFEATAHQLQEEDMGIVLWLPDDEQSLDVRAAALAHWCSGFLAGLAGQGQEALKTLSEEGQEALQDLQELARASVEEGEEGEAEEAAYAEIVEYIRVATLTLYEDLRGPGPGDAIH